MDCCSFSKKIERNAFKYLTIKVNRRKFIVHLSESHLVYSFHSNETQKLETEKRRTHAI